MSNIDSLLKTPLFSRHQEAGARIVDFGGWALPVNYGSQIEEHQAVRQNVGMFDVSHMTVTDIYGDDCIPYLEKVLANDIHKIAGKAGKALYSCMLNEEGGVLDDLIVYYLEDKHCRLVTNAATNKKDMAWLKKQGESFKQLEVIEKPQLALIAVQGPKTIEIMKASFPGYVAMQLDQLNRFYGVFAGEDIFIGRTGYTGEDGVEIIVPNDQADFFWRRLLDAGVQPCGLAARDTLRLEAGMALYGSDLSEDFTPLESGLAWTVSMKINRDFIGRDALMDPSKKKMLGLILEGKGILRSHQNILLNDEVVGEVTSGTFSPSLQQSIALARVDHRDDIQVDDLLDVEIRNKRIPARVVNYPFFKSTTTS